jgi:hypothetical protein
MAHALKWSTHSPVKDCAEVGSGDTVPVSELADGHFLMPFISSSVDTFEANSVEIFGQKYFPGVTLLTDLNEEGEPSFAAVDRIYVHGNDVFFIVVPWLIHEFSSNSRAYGCTLGEERSCIKAKDVVDYKPFHPSCCSKRECIYKHIILRHHLCFDELCIDVSIVFVL